MRKIRFTEHKIIAVLKLVVAGMSPQGVSPSEKYEIQLLHN